MWMEVKNKVVDNPYCYNGNPDHLAEDCAVGIYQSFLTQNYIEWTNLWSEPRNIRAVARKRNGLFMSSSRARWSSPRFSLACMPLLKIKKISQSDEQ